MLGLSENIFPSDCQPLIAAAGEVRRIHVFARIRIEHTLLLIRTPGASQWQVPGGEIEAEVQMESALRRLVLERIGMDVLVGSLGRKVVDHASGLVYCHFHCVPKVWSSRTLATLSRHSDCLVQRWPLEALPHGISLDHSPHEETANLKDTPLRDAASPSPHRENFSLPTFHQTSNCDS